MPNIIVTKRCNLNCEYCFSPKLNQEMRVGVYKKVLLHLLLNKDKWVRLLGGEPMISNKLKDYIKFSLRYGFNVLLFSNLCFNGQYIGRIKNLLKENNYKFKFSVNINNYKFYSKTQLKNLVNNLLFLNKFNVEVELSYLISPYRNIDYKFIDYLIKFASPKVFHLKPYNYSGRCNVFELLTESYWLSFKKLGLFLKKKYPNINIVVSCGFPKKYNYLLRGFNNIKYGCLANRGIYDIDVDGTIFRCFALSSKFKSINISQVYPYSYSKIKKMLDKNKVLYLNEDMCLGYKFNCNV